MSQDLLVGRMILVEQGNQTIGVNALRRVQK
jgi:hypothetical protein